ncbi:NAD(P)/FAD-dependent oxidoreductase [Nonomuraea thailandensis]
MDVLVVGAGLAGLRTACLLARRGLDVLVVDRRRSLSAGIRTTGIFVRRTLDDFDLPDHLLGPGIRDVLLYPPSRRAPIRLTSDRDEFRVADMAAVYRHARHEAESAGARVLLGVRYAGASAGLVRLAGAEPVTARFVVGADGARSRVARDLGLDLNRRFIVGAELVHPIAPGTTAPAFHCVLDPGSLPVTWGGPWTTAGTRTSASRVIRPRCAAASAACWTPSPRTPPVTRRRPVRSSVAAAPSRWAACCGGWRARPGCSSETPRARCRR